MSKVYKRTGKKGSFWYGDYSIGTRRIRKSLGKTKKIAEIRLAELVSKKNRLQDGLPTDSTIEECIDAYLDTGMAGKSIQSNKRAKTVLKKFMEYFKMSNISKISTPL